MCILFFSLCIFYNSIIYSWPVRYPLITIFLLYNCPPSHPTHKPWVNTCLFHLLRFLLLFSFVFISVLISKLHYWREIYFIVIIHQSHFFFLEAFLSELSILVFESGIHSVAILKLLLPFFFVGFYVFFFLGLFPHFSE